MSAKEMFEKLGYEVDEQEECLLYWKKAPKQRLNRWNAQNEIQIEINLIYKTVEKRELFDTDEESNIITLEELQAINQQIKELKWLDE